MTSTTVRRLTGVAVAAVVAGGFTALTAPAASASTVVNIVSHSSYVDSVNYLHVVGEVRNDGTTYAEFMKLNFQFLDASGRLLATDFTYASADRLAPGEKSPFHEITQPPAGYDHYTVSLTAGASTQAPNHNFSTQVTNEFTDSIGYRHIVGTVRNDNTTAWQYVKVLFTFYDSSGQVVNTDFTYVTDSTVSPGQSSTFEESIAPTPAYASCAILTESSTPGSPAASASPAPSPSSSPGTPSPSPSPSSGEITPTLSLAPSVISAGQRVAATYHGAPNSTIQIWSKTQPATLYSRIAYVTLDSSGYGTSSHAPTKNTRIMAKTAGGLESAQPLIQVRSVASINARRIRTQTYTFTGRVYPALNGRLVSLYRNGVLTAQARTDSSGIYTMTKTLARGTFSFQVRTANDTYNLGTSSPARTYSIT